MSKDNHVIECNFTIPDDCRHRYQFHSEWSIFQITPVPPNGIRLRQKHLKPVDCPRAHTAESLFLDWIHMCIEHLRAACEK